MYYYNIWDTLGIDPTDDIKAIKKAYAKKSREVHPDEHPEEFQHLKNCYESAVRFAKNKEPYIPKYDFYEDSKLSDDYHETEEPDSSKIDYKELQFKLGNFQNENLEVEEVTADGRESNYIFRNTTEYDYNGILTLKKNTCDDIIKAINVLMRSERFRNNIRYWKLIFRKYNNMYEQRKVLYHINEKLFPYKKVAAYMMLQLESITGIDSKMYNYMERILFPKYDKDAEWLVLYKMYNLRRSSAISMVRPIRDSFPHISGYQYLEKNGIKISNIDRVIWGAIISFFLLVCFIAYAGDEAKHNRYKASTNTSDVVTEAVSDWNKENVITDFTQRNGTNTNPISNGIHDMGEKYGYDFYSIVRFTHEDVEYVGLKSLEDDKYYIITEQEYGELNFDNAISCEEFLEQHPDAYDIINKISE